MNAQVGWLTVTISGDQSIDRENNCLEKQHETQQAHDTTSQVEINRKELTGKKLQKSDGNNEECARIIHFHESVHVDIPK